MLAGVSALAVVPASRLPDYRPGEVPDPGAGAAASPAGGRPVVPTLPEERT